ncbi:hypothetical protein COLO4_01901 [Corchorus olitorius]|uniref:Uncharacterized protein n=1 Tax=Corchorus olitorius TaxID=93759 RepID=A0A1R3L211_9ROSI|nr:hypothetical protein COLO4_01901 [Corchorus olitorius]
MRVGLDEAVAGKVFAAVAHAGLQQAVHEAAGQRRHHARVAVEAAVADDAAGTVVKVQHRGEAEIHAAGAQFGAQHVAGRRGGVHGSQGAAAFALLAALAVVHPHLAEGAHGRQMRESVGTKTLHAPALVVHADQQVGFDALDIGAQLHQLLAAFPVAGEEDDAADQRMRQAPAVRVGERLAGDVDDQGCVLGHAMNPVESKKPALRRPGVRRGARPRRSWPRSRSRRSRTGAPAGSVPRTIP